MANIGIVLRGGALLLVMLGAGPAVLMLCRTTVAGSLRTVADRTDPASVLPAAVVLLAAAVLAVVWLWLALCVAACLSDVLSDALSGRRRPVTSASRLRPHAVRMLVGVVAGSAIAAGAAPAVAVDRGATTAPSVAGLRLPERTIGGVRLPPAAVVKAPGATPADQADREHVVAPGETLWGITERLLPVRSTAADVDRGWRALYRANQPRVGADPDLVLPGTALRVPAELHDTDTDTGEEP